MQRQGYGARGVPPRQPRGRGGRDGRSVACESRCCRVVFRDLCEAPGILVLVQVVDLAVDDADFVFHARGANKVNNHVGRHDGVVEGGGFADTLRPMSELRAVPTLKALLVFPTARGQIGER